jgi:hypothetical protein
MHEKGLLPEEVDAKTALTVLSCNIFLQHNYGFDVEVRGPPLITMLIPCTISQTFPDV